MPITILYEDQMGPVAQFGLHELILACIFDLIDGQFYEIEKRIRPHLAKGDSKLLLKCREEVQYISPNGEPVVAVFDNDKIRRLLQLPATANDDEVVAAIIANSPNAAQVCVTLLKENMESVLEAVRECDASIDSEQLARALNKELAARDIVLKKVAKKQAALAPVRDCILRTNPSLRSIVEYVCGLLT